MELEKPLENNTAVVLIDGILKTICLNTGEIISANNLALRNNNEVYVYTVPVATLICDYLRSGMPFSKIAELPHMPPYNIMAAWRKRYPDFAEAIKAAKKDRAEIYHDKALLTAEAIETEEDAKVAKLKIDTYKWAAEKNSPDEYGKAPPKEGNSGVTFVINTGVPNTPPTIIEVEDGFRDITDIREADAVEADEREVPST
jgi:hypothetical protein